MADPRIKKMSRSELMNRKKVLLTIRTRNKMRVSKLRKIGAINTPIGRASKNFGAIINDDLKEIDERLEEK